MRSASPLMEFTSAEPGQNGSAAAMASALEESRERGSAYLPVSRSTSPGSSRVSSTIGAPTFTSRIGAPRATCSEAKRRARPYSPACNSACKSFLPVGLIRSPIMVKGWEGLILTSLVRVVSTRPEGVTQGAGRRSTAATARRRARM